MLSKNTVAQQAKLPHLQVPDFHERKVGRTTRTPAFSDLVTASTGAREGATSRMATSDPKGLVCSSKTQVPYTHYPPYSMTATYSVQWPHIIIDRGLNA
jgi:hypothetical protein